MKNILKSCLNPKVIISMIVVIVLLYIFVPQITRFSWILLILLCPLSMMFMMKGMKGMGSMSNQEKTFACSECGLAYQEREWAQKCRAWCKEHHTCNVEITKHAVYPVK